MQGSKKQHRLHDDDDKDKGAGFSYPSSLPRQEPTSTSSIHNSSSLFVQQSTTKKKNTSNNMRWFNLIRNVIVVVASLLLFSRNFMTSLTLSAKAFDSASRAQDDYSFLSHFLNVPQTEVQSNLNISSTDNDDINMQQQQGAINGGGSAVSKEQSQQQPHNNSNTQIYTDQSNIAKQQQQGRGGGYQHKRPVGDGLRIPTPIFVLSLPKSGTTSLYRYFQCGGVYSAHTYGTNYTYEASTQSNTNDNDNNDVDDDGSESNNNDNNQQKTAQRFRLAQCLRHNWQHGRPLLYGCGQHKMYSDLGFVGPAMSIYDVRLKKDKDTCFYPSLQALDNIVQYYPNATVIVSYRSQGWYESVKKYNYLAHRWQLPSCPPFPNATTGRVSPAAWEEFYQDHRRRIRQRLADTPSIQYLEFDLLDPTAGAMLQNFTGISHECWGNCKPNLRCEFPTHNEHEMFAQRQERIQQQRRRRKQNNMNMMMARQQQQQQQQPPLMKSHPESQQQGA